MAGDTVNKAIGRVREVLPEGKVLVDIGQDHCIIAEISAKIRVRFARIRSGVYVRCELSPYEPGKVRVVGFASSDETSGRMSGQV